MRDIDPTASEYITSGYLERSRPNGVFYDIGSVLGIGSALLGSDSAGDAVDAQTAAAAKTDATNRYIFDKQTSLQEPFRQSGVSANNILSYLMGLGGSPNGTPSAGAPSVRTADQLRASLLSQFTTPGRPAGETESALGGVNSSWAATPDTVNEAGLAAAIAQAQAGDNAALQAWQTQQNANSNDPNYGSLMKSFSASDFQADPGYQFRMSEGLKGVEGSAAARGGLLSGGALKGIQKYGQDLGSQEYGAAYGRYNSDQTNKYNKLAGMVNSGQGATNKISNAAGQYGTNTASNNAALGNAQAAGSIAQGNAWQGALGTIGNNYQQNQLMQMIQRPLSSTIQAPADYGQYF